MCALFFFSQRSSGGAAPSERSDAERGQGRFALEDAETRLLAEGAHGRADAGADAGAGGAGHEDSDELPEAGEDDEDDGGAVDGAVSSPRASRRARRRGLHSGSTGADKGSAGAGAGTCVGGPNHLLFLLGERDTALNKQQSMVSALQRRVHALQARLELAQALPRSHEHGAASGGGRGAATTATGVNGDDDDVAAAGGASMEHFHSQLSGLRASLSARLRAQLAQVLHSSAAAGEAGPSPRVAAYVADLERWLVWEASARAVEKTALNAQCLRAEKMAQDRSVERGCKDACAMGRATGLHSSSALSRLSFIPIFVFIFAFLSFFCVCSWVRSRLLESEVHELQQRLQQQDAKTRAIDTKLAAASVHTRTRAHALAEARFRVRAACEHFL